jgi:DNA-binding CsgD family transcriptional regulator
MEPGFADRTPALTMPPGASRVPQGDRSLDRLLGSCARLAQAVGATDFYVKAAACVGELLGCERRIVMRYSQYATPEFLLNASLSEEARRHYAESVYRLDPLMKLVRTKVTDRVLTFRNLKQSGADLLFYDETFRTASILDELVMMLPAVGGVWVAICVDRETSHFDQSDIDEANAIYDLIEVLHAQHIERCLFQRNDGFLNDSKIGLLIIDSQGFPVLRNQLWQRRVSPAAEQDVLRASVSHGQGISLISDALILHWETLDSSNGVAPCGRAFVLEDRAPGYADLNAHSVVQRFAKENALTPRETEIVEHILTGNPPERIAKALGIGLGTIRNHKHRLYYKLDITTERELFSMLFNSLSIRSSITNSIS